MSRFLAWRLAWRALTARSTGARFLVSGSLAMALGLVPLVVVLSVADGMIGAISSRTIETALYHVQVWGLTRQTDLDATSIDLNKRLSAVSGFRSLWPEQDGFALGYSVRGRLGLSVRGVSPGWPAGDAGAARYLKAVSGDLTLREGEVWLGREAASRLGVVPGDSLKLLTTLTKGRLTLPRVTTVRVAAVVSVGYQELDRLWLFAPLGLTTKLFDPVEDPLFWGVKGDFPLDRTKEFLADVRAALGPSWQAVSWQTTGRSQFLNYQATRALLAVVMALVLLVAAVNVSTAMVLTVGERRRETAILKALGADDRLIVRQFLWLGLGAGLLGTAAGLGLGMAVAASLNTLIAVVDTLVGLFTPGGFHLLSSSYYLESLPVSFDPVSLGGAGLGSVLLAVAASWLPSRRAARERPLEVLRRA